RHDRQHRRQEGDDVGRPHRAGRVVPGGAERDDQEEAEEDARAREADTDLVEELDELLVLLLAKLLAVHAATIALATVSSRGTRSRQPRASPTGAARRARRARLVDAVRGDATSPAVAVLKTDLARITRPIPV